MKLQTPYKIVGTVDAAVIDAFIEALDMEAFKKDNKRSRMGNLQYTRAIILRHDESYIANALNEAEKGDKLGLTDFSSMLEYRKHVDTILSALSKHYIFKDYAMLLALLFPRRSVGKHVDSGEFLDTCHRVHIPLITNPECFYTVGDQTWHMEKGTIYEIDNQRIHGVINGGNEDRVHLIVNLYPK